MNRTEIRNQIYLAHKEYSTKLAGKVFMYVYGDEYFEVLFKVDKFKHLTGVESRLSGKAFYNYAKRKILSPNQFYFTNNHPYRTSVKKLEQLKTLSVITQNQVCAIKNLSTLTFTYGLGITNLDLTLCLIEDTDIKGNLLSSYYVPMSLRIKDKSIEMSNEGEFVDFIFEKSAEDTIYKKLNFAASGKSFPDCIKSKIDSSFFYECVL